MRIKTSPGGSSTLEAGLFCVIVAVPLAFTPFSAHSFVDAKLVLLLAGTFLITLARSKTERRIAIAALVWLATVAVATVAGLDPWWSLLGDENRGMGLLALGACAVLLCAGTGVDEVLRARLPVWIFWTGVAVSTVAVVGRFVDIGGQSWSLGDLSSTIGHRVFVGGFVATAAVAATSIELRPKSYAGLIALGSGLAVTAARSAWIAVVLGMLVVLWRSRRWRLILTVLAPIVIAIAAWTFADGFIADKPIEFSAAPRFGQLDEGSATERLPAVRANLRAWGDDPILGSGPSTGWHGYLSHVTPDEMRSAGRGFSDAHNILVEAGTTTGTLGALALVGLGLVTLAGTRRGRIDRDWALGTAVALGVVHTLQPLNLVLTPLMFLTAGLAVSETTGRIRLGRWVAALTAVGLIATSARFVASSFERYGSTYASETAYRWSLRIEPWRLGAALQLAEHRAFDYRTEDPTAAADASRFLRKVVGQHGWNPRVRLVAANIEILLDDPPAAARWIEEHLRIFPNDPAALSVAAALALRSGDRARAATLAERAVLLDPDLEQARAILRATRERRD